MKYLQDYMEDKQSALFAKTGSFFAFSKKQFEESKKDGVKYVSIGGGLLCPKENAKELVDSLGIIWNEAVKQDLKESGKEGIIKRELYNHECFYTGDYSAAYDAVSHYGFTLEDVKRQYYKELPKINNL